MGLILNIETSTQICSVSLANKGNTIAILESKDKNSHASQITVLIEKLFKETDFLINQLDAVAISKGPGSYTGLRIGVSTAKGICYGLNIPLIAVNTLEALANGINRNNISNEELLNTLLCPMIDARRMEVYTAIFNLDLSIQSPVQAKIIDEIAFKEILEEHKILFFGDGSEKCKNTIKHPNAQFIDNIDNSSRFMSSLSQKAFINKQFENLAYFEPFYLKDFVAIVSKKNVLE